MCLKHPGCRVGHTQVPLELQGRDVVLGLRPKVHGQEPGRKWQLAGLEDRAADQTALVAAAAALEVQPRTPAELAVPAMGAARATEPFRPSPAPHGGLTLLWRAIGTEEVQHRTTTLILNSVLRHSSPAVGISTSLRVGSSQSEPEPGWAERLLIRSLDDPHRGVAAAAWGSRENVDAVVRFPLNDQPSAGSPNAMQT